MLLVDNDFYEFEDFQLQPARRILLRNGQRLHMAPKSFEVLLYLVQHAGRVVVKSELLEGCWPGAFVEKSNLTQHVFWARKALGEKAGWIVTVPGRGYEFTGEVRLVQRPAALIEVVSLAGPREAPRETVSGTGVSPAEECRMNGTALSAPLWRKGSIKVVGTGVALGLLVAAGGLTWQKLTKPLELKLTGTKRITNDGNPKSVGYDTVLVRDGKFLYFTEKQDDKSIGASVPEDGGAVQLFPVPFTEARVVDYSNSRKQLLFGTEWELSNERFLKTTRTDGTEAASLQELMGHDATWSPDGKKLVFATARLLYVSDGDGANARLIHEGAGLLYYPRWSPDGKKIRFSQHVIGMETQIWELNADGTGLRQWFIRPADRNQICCGNWSKDGRFYFFLVGPANHQKIWASRERNLLYPAGDPFPIDGGPMDRWLGVIPNEDATKLWAVGSDLRVELNRIDPSTREMKPALGGLSVEGVNYSPDSNWIAFTEYPEGTLWVSRLDGSQRKRLSDEGAIARFPKWSPDGKTICFLAGKGDSKWTLYLVNADGGGLRLLSPEMANQGAASWSVDGRKIAFSRQVNFGDQHAPDLSIQLLDLQTKQQSTLRGSAGLSTCRWSPNGRYMSAVTANSKSLRLFDFETQEWRTLVNADINDVAWSPDSRSLYFDTHDEAGPELMRIEIPSGRVVQWANLAGIHRGGFFSPWLGVDRDGVPLLLRDRSIAEIYRLSLSQVH